MLGYFVIKLGDNTVLLLLMFLRSCIWKIVSSSISCFHVL